MPESSEARALRMERWKFFSLRGAAFAMLKWAKVKHQAVLQSPLTSPAQAQAAHALEVAAQDFAEAMKGCPWKEPPDAADG